MTALGREGRPGLLQRLDTVHGLLEDGPEPVPRVNGIVGQALVPTWNFQGERTSHHDAGSGRPIPKEAGSCAFTTSPTQPTAASICTQGACTCTCSTPRARPASRRTYPPGPTPSSTPSHRTATAWSSAANACSPGTGSPTCARISTSPSFWATPCTSRPSTPARPTTTGSTPPNRPPPSPAAPSPLPTTTP